MVKATNVEICGNIEQDIRLYKERSGQEYGILSVSISGVLINNQKYRFLTIISNSALLNSYKEFLIRDSKIWLSGKVTNTKHDKKFLENILLPELGDNCSILSVDASGDLIVLGKDLHSKDINNICSTEVKLREDINHKILNFN